MIRYRRSSFYKLPARDCKMVKLHHAVCRSLREIIELLGSGEIMVARLKLKGIDGRAHHGVELAAQFDSTRENLRVQDKRRIDRLIALS